MKKTKTTKTRKKAAAQPKTVQVAPKAKTTHRSFVCTGASKEGTIIGIAAVAIMIQVVIILALQAVNL